MPRPPDLARRAELVDALVDAYAAHGLTRSLRELATELGTSHRMLLHHFGSREEMLVAVVEAVERRQAGVLATTEAGSPAEMMERSWEVLSDPALRPFERLFFECYVRGSNGESPFDRLLPGAVTSWLEADQTDDPDLARLGLAVIRGLLLDLVGTDDEEANRRALQRFAALVAPKRRPHKQRS